MCPNQDRTRYLGMYPEWELNWWPFTFLPDISEKYVPQIASLLAQKVDNFYFSTSFLQVKVCVKKSPLNVSIAYSFSATNISLWT